MSVTPQATPRRPGPPSAAKRSRALLVVGDHVGHPGGDAVQAVRRAGMRPALDRSFGYSAAQRGLVVEQDPASGTEVARNAMVTLYVAAPSPGAGTDSPAELSARAPRLEDEQASRDVAQPPGADESEHPRRPLVSEEASRPNVADDLATEEFIAARGAELEEPASSGLEDPFSRDAEVSGRLRPVYPRRPIGLTVRGALRRAWRYRLAALAALVLAAALAGHSAGGRPGGHAALAREPAAAPVIPRPTARRARARRHFFPSRTAASGRTRRKRAAAAKARSVPTEPHAVTDTAHTEAPISTRRPSESTGGPFSP